MAELALWAYCVARTQDALPEGLPGVDAGHGVERVEHGGLAALVSAVPDDEYNEDALRRNLNDFSWLERVALAHEAVLEQALAAATIVPLRLCTIFADEAGVRDMLDDQRDALAGALDALDGREEWSVKLLVDRGALEAASGAEPPAHAEGSGAAYLLGRRRERDAREQADRVAGELAEEVHTTLREAAADAVIGRPQNPELSGHEGEMLLNVAYLVERGQVERLRALVGELGERHRERGARLELSGPLPPYNFVPRPQEAPA